MDEQNAKSLIYRLSRSESIALTSHCKERMRERNVTMHDILNTLMWGDVSDIEFDDPHGNYKCKVTGSDIEGDELIVIVTIIEADENLLVITVC